MPAFPRKPIYCVPLLLLAACASRQEPVPNGAPVVSTNGAVFDPTTGDIPLPNILATAAAADPITGLTSLGAATVSPAPPLGAGTPMTPPQALAYINAHEVGWTNAVSGVNAPIYLRFSYPVQASTVNGANIKVFQIAADTSATSSYENMPLTFTDITGMFTFKYPAGGTDLWLYPSFPLLPGTRYAYVVTNRVLDAATAAPIIPSAYFQYLESTTPLTGAAQGLEVIRANAMSGTNILLSGYAKVMDDLIAGSKTTTITSRGDLALMGRFITSGAGFVSETAAGPMIPVESALRAFAAGGLPGGLPGKVWDNTVAVSGTLTGAALEGFWEGVTGQTNLPAASKVPVPASIGAMVLGTINSASLGMDPVVVASSKGTMDLTGVTVTRAGKAYPADDDPAGVVQPFTTGGNLVGYYHVPKAIPFLYMVPQTPPPTPAGYPLVIYQHGITSQKETVILLGQALTQAGYAALAIDLPMHGALSAPTSTQPAQWGQDFMAVGAPLATRSNVQQGAFNLHRLELSVTAGGFAMGLHAAGLDAYAPARGTYHFVGISLGSIVGAYYLAGNTTLSPTGLPYTQTTLNGDMKGLLSVPGGRLAYLIQASPAFGATVDAGLEAVGITPGTPIYHQFFQATQTVVDTADPATMTTPLAAGLPSRLSGRLLMQEATSTDIDANGNPTNGDTVITNPFSRYFANALGGEAVLGFGAPPAVAAVSAAIAPNFAQVGYVTDTPAIPVQFMGTLTAGVPAPKDVTAAIPGAASGAGEGYFQFGQKGIEHQALLDLTNPQNAYNLQSQMVFFLGMGGLPSMVVDPTLLPFPPAAPTPAMSKNGLVKVHTAAIWPILGH